MHRRHPYGPHLTAALHPPCKSLDIQAHRLAPRCECGPAERPSSLWLSGATLTGVR